MHKKYQDIVGLASDVKVSIDHEFLIRIQQIVLIDHWQ